MRLLKEHGYLENSRAGEVYVLPAPVITCWLDPRQRVLFNQRRHANHAFHINEFIWMLQGHKDARILDRFIHNFSERFAEPNGQLHGAYGFRWLRAFGRDQIHGVVDVLKQDRNSRQAVIQMWDPSADLGAQVRDKPCNTTLYFRINKEKLDMTVCNRSNDIIWGLYGANAVHFSMLMEYIARQIGISVGTMYTLSNNFHAYRSLFEVMYEEQEEYPAVNYPTLQLGDTPREMERFWMDAKDWQYTGDGEYKSIWFNHVAVPLTRAFYAKVEKKWDFMDVQIKYILDESWQMGMDEWCHHAKQH